MTMTQEISQAAMEARARRAARSAGYLVRKSRWRTGSIDNFGHFMLVNPYTNCVIAGSRFELTAEEVIELCKD